MGFASENGDGGHARAVGRGLNEADRAALLALRAWAGPFGLRPGPALWGRLEPAWEGRLRAAWEDGFETAVGPEAACAELARVHRALARSGPGRAHPSWRARALREEPSAVQRAVTAAAPLAVRRVLQSELLLDDDDLRADRPAVPDALAAVLSLWGERLVGGDPERADDAPEVSAIVRLAPREALRLCRCAGLAKQVLAGAGDAQPGPNGNGGAAEQTRAHWLRERMAGLGPEHAAVARHDLAESATWALPARRRQARLGLLSIARLLSDAEPFRVRWALQHWPYAVAKLARGLMPPEKQKSAVLSLVETAILRAAWERTNLEGRTRLAWPGEGPSDEGPTRSATN